MDEDTFLEQLTSTDIGLLEKEDLVLDPLLPEINLIVDSSIRSFVRAVLLRSGSFWEIPATISNAQHPRDEREEGGNVLHTGRVTRIAAALAESYGLEVMERDAVIAAALLHGVTKGVEVEEVGIQFDPFHPYTVGQLVMSIQEAEKEQEKPSTGSSALRVDSEVVDQILRLVRCHLGLWSPIPETVPNHPLEWLVHQSDYLATRLHMIMERDPRWP